MDQIYSFNGKEYNYDELNAEVNKCVSVMIQNFESVKEVLAKVRKSDKHIIKEEENKEVMFALNKYEKLMDLTDQHSKEILKSLDESIKKQDITAVLKSIERDLRLHEDLIVSLFKHLEKYTTYKVDKRIVEVAIDHDIKLVDLSIETLGKQKEFINGSANFKDKEKVMDL